MRRALRAETVHRLFIPGEKCLRTSFAEGIFLHHFHLALQLQPVPARLAVVRFDIALVRHGDVGQQRAGLVAAFEAWDGRRQRLQVFGVGRVDADAVQAVGAFQRRQQCLAKLRRIGVRGFDVQIESHAREGLQHLIQPRNADALAAERVRIPLGESPAGVDLGQLRGGIGRDRALSVGQRFQIRRAIQHDDAVFGFLQGDPDGVGAVFQRGFDGDAGVFRRIGGAAAVGDDRRRVTGGGAGCQRAQRQRGSQQQMRKSDHVGYLFVVVVVSRTGWRKSYY